MSGPPAAKDGKPSHIIGRQPEVDVELYSQPVSGCFFLLQNPGLSVHGPLSDQKNSSCLDQPCASEKLMMFGPLVDFCQKSRPHVGDQESSLRSGLRYRHENTGFSGVCFTILPFSYSSTRGRGSISFHPATHSLGKVLQESSGGEYEKYERATAFYP